MLVARERFELSSMAPKATMLDHYTNGLFCCSDKFILPYKSPSYNTVNIHMSTACLQGCLATAGQKKWLLCFPEKVFKVERLYVFLVSCDAKSFSKNHKPFI